MYMGFLMSEPKSSTCTRLSEVMGISHDSVNRFLLREAYEPCDLFNEAARLLNLVGGTLNVDDSTLDKPYSQHMELVGHFWSGKHHPVVKGLNLITLYYSDPQGRSLPVNYRVYDKAEGKTNFQQTDFQSLHDQHWQIEQYHRMIKQVCHIEKFQVRGKVPIRNRIFAA